LRRETADTYITLVSPVAGTVEAIVRGARRAIERIVVKPVAEGTPAQVKFETDTKDAASVKRALKLSGLWAMMRQRPYDIVPDPTAVPRDIFVTAMDTAPLALPLEEVVRGREADLRAGVEALALLTKGTIYIGVAKGSALAEIEGAEIVEFTPLHPAGNAGIQAANIAPVNKGETIWTLDIMTLARIGALMTSGVADTSATVAITGSEADAPHVVRTVVGADIRALLGKEADEAAPRHLRIISGNVLTGLPVGADGYLRYPYRQVTVIPEGDNADEFMGWASLSPSKLSVSHSFPGSFLGRLFKPDARLNGGRRAMIMSGVYDRYLPMDILPEYLRIEISGK
ncbi:MAG: NADH:ubiquinone reductase (Na(+)-transporting) subunit A, partial [Duncaniella sp.]|nr:NADH:ubiquinone reductase (Na(+)-transporting) subunit A [Duncaniella sp.]